MAKCPECDHNIEGPFEPAEVLACPCCGIELEVNQNRQLVVLQLEGEDWGE